MSNHRQVFFDTETTGLDHRTGHRITEIAAIEVIDGEPTGRVFHSLLNPDREVDKEVTEKVTGHTWEMLKDYPRFRDKAQEFLDFIEGAELIAYNSSFDEEFVQAELERIKYPRTIWEVAGKTVDALTLSRRILASEKIKNFKLDTLLDYFEIDRSMREKHDALLDCQLLFKMYQKLMDGVDLSGPSLEDDVPRPAVQYLDASKAAAIPAISVSPEQQSSHEEYLKEMAEATKVSPVSWGAKPSRPRP